MENTVLRVIEVDKSEQLSKFTQLVDTVARLAKIQNVTVKTTSPESLQKIQAMDISDIETRNMDLMKYTTVLQESILGEKRITNKDMTKNILGFMKFTTSDDLINSISEDDIVEIYNLDCIQIFRNFKFYQTTTYSLSDLIVYDWSELYYRPSQVSQKIQQHITTVFGNEENDIAYDMADVPTHMIKEIKANPIQLCEITFKKIAPITDRAGKRSGLIVTCQAKSMLSNVAHEGIDFI